MALYEITYAVIPPGVGPDDYEPSQLEHRTGTFDLPAPHRAGTLPNGTPITYGPPMPVIHDAIEETLPDGATVHVVDIRLTDG